MCCSRVGPKWWYIKPCQRWDLPQLPADFSLWLKVPAGNNIKKKKNREEQTNFDLHKTTITMTKWSYAGLGLLVREMTFQKTEKCKGRKSWGGLAICEWMKLDVRCETEKISRVKAPQFQCLWIIPCSPSKMLSKVSHSIDMLSIQIDTLKGLRFWSTGHFFVSFDFFSFAF